MSFEDSNYTVPKSYVDKTRYGQDFNQAVVLSYDFSLSYLESYFTTHNIQNGHFFQEFTKYKEKHINYEQISFSILLEHFSDKKLLKDNKEFYSEIASFLEYASDNNKLHRKRREHYENFLKIALFEDNKNAMIDDKLESLKALDYSQYEANNFRINDDNDLLNAIHKRGGTIFLNSDGKICCRFFKNSELKVYSKRQAEMMLSKEFGFAIEITEDMVDESPTESFKNQDIIIDCDVVQ